MNEIWNIINQKSNSRTPFFFMIDFECSRAVVEDLPLDPSEVMIDFPNYRNVSYPQKTLPFSFRKQPISILEYKKQFEKVKFHLQRGDTFLLNLTNSTPITSSLGLKMLFAAANAKYRLFVPGMFTVFSPETFIKISNNIISSYPMKGTIDADLPDAENQLINDQKEIDEHNTIVDLIRNDLNSVSANVRVTKYRYVDKITTNNKALLQVSSEIQGDLPENWQSQLGTILSKLLPAGSISGAPKPKTLEIINSVESNSRGYYTGVMGVFDGDSLDSAVMIRFIEQTENGLMYRSGGGITINSMMEDEYQELIDKVYVPTV